MQISKIGNFSNISYKGNETAPKKENFISKIKTNLKSEDSFVSKHKKEIKIGAAILTGTLAIAGAALFINKKGGSKAVEKVTNEIANNDEALNKAEKIKETASEKLEPIVLKTLGDVENGKRQPITINIDEATGKPVLHDIDSAAVDLTYFIIKTTGGDTGLAGLASEMKERAPRNGNILHLATSYVEKHEKVEQALVDYDKVVELKDKYYPETEGLYGRVEFQEGGKDRNICNRFLKIGDDMKQFYDEKTKTFDDTGLREFCKNLDL